MRARTLASTPAHLAAIDAAIAEDAGWLTAAQQRAQDEYYAAEQHAEQEAERGYESWLERQSDAEYAIIERDAPWAL